MAPRSPQFKGEPVILIHLGTDESKQGKHLAACSGEEFYNSGGDSYRNIPRVPCTGCLLSLKGKVLFDGRRS